MNIDEIPQPAGAGDTVLETNVVPATSGSIVRQGSIRSVNYGQNSFGWKGNSDGSFEANYLIIKTKAGIPTTADIGTGGLIYDTTNNKLYYNNGGTLKSVTFT